MTEVHNVRSSLKLCKEQGRVYLVKVKITTFNSSKRMWYWTELKKSCQLGVVHASLCVHKARVQMFTEDKSTEALGLSNTDNNSGTGRLSRIFDLLLPRVTNLKPFILFSCNLASD